LISNQIKHFFFQIKKNRWGAHLFKKANSNSGDEAHIISSSTSSSELDTAHELSEQSPPSASATTTNNANADTASPITTPAATTSATTLPQQRGLSRQPSSMSHEAYHASNYRERYIFSWFINFVKLK
jgi:hypothetical protein